MTNNRYAAAQEPLPPRPNSRTGSPRPPRASIDVIARSDDEQEVAPGARSEQFRPAPPPGQGPVLEWYETSTREALKTTLSGMASSLMLVLCGFLLQLGPLRMLLFIPLVTGALVLVREQTDSCAAGADWFAAKKRWVELYELRFVATSEPFVRDMLTLKDRSGRKVKIRLDTARKNRALWDLVYNGILHSLVQGDAVASQETRSKLRLPDQLDHLTIRGANQ